MKAIFTGQDLLHPGVMASIRQALDEDIGSGDVTTDSIVPAKASMRGQIIAKQEGIIAGLDVAEACFRVVDPGVAFTPAVGEGERVRDRQVLVELEGPARPLLTGERTALNFLGRMSGIATLTRQFVDAVEGTRAVILDTRKTAPGLRLVDKLAVRRGGGQNHRIGLFDMILIKDNHIDFAGSLEAAVKRARSVHADMQVEVEARSLEDVQKALQLDVDRILLDNMTPNMLSEAVRMTAGRKKLEASGNVTLKNVRQIAETGVDFISIGALTHSARTFDVSLDWVKS